jgi:hypothetical protein
MLYLSFFVSMPAIVKYKLFNLRTCGPPSFALSLSLFLSLSCSPPTITTTSGTWLFGLLSILGLWAHIHADIRDGVRTVSSVVLRVVRVMRVVCAVPCVSCRACRSKRRANSSSSGPR